jgi:hypothetical protein
MFSVPSPEVRATIAEKLSLLSLAVETSPSFNRASPAASGGLYHVWDFVKRTEYMLSEVEGIRQPGYQFQHAGQIKISMLLSLSLSSRLYLFYIYIYVCVCVHYIR